MLPESFKFPFHLYKKIVMHQKIKVVKKIRFTIYERKYTI